MRKAAVSQIIKMVERIADESTSESDKATTTTAMIKLVRKLPNGDLTAMLATPTGKRHAAAIRAMNGEIVDREAQITHLKHERDTAQATIDQLRRDLETAQT